MPDSHDVCDISRLLDDLHQAATPHFREDVCPMCMGRALIGMGAGLMASYTIDQAEALRVEEVIAGTVSAMFRAHLEEHRQRIH